MSLNQIKHSGVMLRRGLEACEAVGGAKLHSTRMRYMLGVCRVMGCGSGAAGDAASDDGDDTAWTMEEIEDLQVRNLLHWTTRRDPQHRVMRSHHQSTYVVPMRHVEA